MINRGCSSQIDKLVRASYPKCEKIEGEMRYFELDKIGWTKRRFSGRGWLNEFDGNSGIVPTEQIEVTFTIWAVGEDIMFSLFRVLLNHTDATDYLLPIFLALFTFSYCNYGGWQGNLFNIFFFE